MWLHKENISIYDYVPLMMEFKEVADCSLENDVAGDSCTGRRSCWSEGRSMSR